MVPFLTNTRFVGTMNSATVNGGNGLNFEDSIPVRSRSSSSLVEKLSEDAGAHARQWRRLVWVCSVRDDDNLII